MGDADDLIRENEMLRERLSRLSEASLRVNDTLDLATVLQGVLDSARSLTGAAYGAMVLLDDVQQIQSSLTSGLTADQSQQLLSMAGGMRFFEHIGGMAKPVRHRDFGTTWESWACRSSTLPCR